ncbi:MAG TPA: hypothetical protein H9987_01840 [Candidatus Luteococcus avicola]|nr:hypothetical protein [Candidatus Luteococcus avicola]
MRLAAAIAAESTDLVGLGRAPRVALLDVEDGVVTGQEIVETQWDVLHGDHGNAHGHEHAACEHGHHNHPGEGAHHARIVTFLRDNKVEAVMAAHAGPPMVNTLSKMGLPFLTGQGDAAQLAVEAARIVSEG